MNSNFLSLRLPFVCLIVLVSGRLLAAAESTTAVAKISAPASLGGSQPFYTANRQPLAPSPVMKLPIGAITPRGWLRTQLELEASGLPGHLEEISPWCKFESNAWASPIGVGHSGWEEMPYWLKGYGDLGYVLGDQRIIKGARRWIEATLASQEQDGWFGPRESKTSLEGHPDIWPNMLMMNVLQSYYEYSADPRVIPFLTRYCQWLNRQSPKTFGYGYWPKIRAGDNLETVYWLYNRTGDAFLLELGAKIHGNMQDWTTGVHDWHNVNVSQGFREPGVYFVQAKDAKFLQAAENNYQTVMGTYGQFPGGGFAGDENCRPGHTDPHQGFETCGIVELMHSFEMLFKISGDPVWSDRNEDLAFNSLPAAMTPDEKGLHYLTCANGVQLDASNHAPGIQNSGTMLSYSPFEVYRCCQHNVSHGWPYYAEELWLATGDGGLCASLYADSEVRAKVGGGDGVALKISEETDYPFNDTVTLRVSSPRAVKFPLYLRVPGWCASASVSVNGRDLGLKASAISFAIIDREWSDGDTVTLRLPMKLSVRRWEKNHRAASVELGPLSFSLKIGENWRTYGGSASWPEYEVLPKTAWNYGLVLDAADATRGLEVSRKAGPVKGNPFTQENVPVQIRTKARKIAGWTVDRFGLAGVLQDSPIRSEEPLETVDLIPMGAARLRITAFPVIGDGASAHEWVVAKPPPVSASHCFQGDTVEAMIDGIEPKSSGDQSIPRFTWWDHKGSDEWVQWDFAMPKIVSGVKVYWFDDAPGGGCRVPASWKVLYNGPDGWKEPPGAVGGGTSLNGYNRVSFAPVQNTALKLEVRFQPGFSAGILEWKVE